eukprot:CAMPEP_0113938032 /NCGR_PEP_ID=MMETSP1339-20121228/4470_1 /TAXON_ID=94617 /ORGANISM="Fibrocapsa japonica" /LENGTH=278 /DNA_ID=CAMNT_0000940963 /DNA_START=93 /DNA_END=929 /DNA_ORIENTATION=+ /assembly_acc=CAM_ASM_000762
MEAFNQLWYNSIFVFIFTEYKSIFVFIFTVVASFVVLKCLFSPRNQEAETTREEESEPDPPRNFTADQLKEYNGESQEKIYLSMKGKVFDVSRKTQSYGPEGPYHLFAGRECGRSLAKMSFEEEDLGTARVDDLSSMEKDQLKNWMEDFEFYKQYPVVGRLVAAPKGDKEYTCEELRKSNGCQEVPEGYAAAPILIAVKGTVFDMSFGGVGFYGPGGPYHVMAGRDASRSLAKMSLDVNDVESPDISDLNDKEKKVLDDWFTRFLEVRKYPVCGKLVK